MERKTINGKECVIEQYPIEDITIKIIGVISNSNPNMVEFRTFRPKEFLPLGGQFTILCSILDYYDEIGFMANYINKFGLHDDNLLDSVLLYCKEHINKYGRIIDNDLYALLDKTIILQMSIYLRYGYKLSEEEIENKWLSIYNSVIKNYKNNLYITKYAFKDPLNPIPYLVKASELSYEFQNKLDPNSIKIPFTSIEKIAVSKVLEEIIRVDGKIENTELAYLNHLFVVIGIESDLFFKSKEMESDEAINILKSMSKEKKTLLAIMMYEMARVDGFVDNREKEFIAKVIITTGIDILKGEIHSEEINLNDVYFVSSDHKRYENGIHVSGPHNGAKRAIKIESNIEGNEGYSVSILNLEGNHPLWNNNIQMSPKQMRVDYASENKIVLKGWGSDPKAMGHPDGLYSNYGITITLKKKNIEKIILHMYDRKIDIEYFK